MKKTYRITVNGGYIDRLLSELKEWGVEENLYTAVGDSVITNSKNVIDVATETFFDASHLLEIKEISHEPR